MKLSPQTQHALMSMLVLASQQKEDQPIEEAPLVALSGLSGRIRISVSYLEQLFKQLREASLVVSQRGPDGGYRLSRASSQITLAQVARAVNPQRKAYMDEPHQHLLDRLNVHIDHFLDNVTLADILAPVEGTEKDEPAAAA
ncbi:MAG TPA: Rrf2 family transcriptional regulator [Gammaproteobacteria bacterium]|nr:Rrf2 family transcriptional regulator [Gammaproteobacteria bacterium]